MSRTKLSFSLTLACVSVRTKSTLKLLLRNESQEWCAGICSPQFRHRFEACARVQGRTHRSRARCHQKSTITIFFHLARLMSAKRVIQDGGTRKSIRTLPKNGESRRHSVGFCRLVPCNITPSRRCLTLTAVLSIESRVSP